MDESAKDRLLQLISRLNLSQGKFEKLTGLSNGYVNKLRRSPSTEIVKKIVGAIPYANPIWLLTGEGTMFIDPNEQETTPTEQEGYSLVPLVPIGAKAGAFSDYSPMGIELAKCEKVISPVPGCDLAIDVSGDSMEPDFPNGCRVFCRRIYEEAFIAWGNVFVLDTCNGAFIKKVFPSSDTTAIEVRSINPDYPSFTIPKPSIFGMYRVLMMTRGYAAS